MTKEQLEKGMEGLLQKQEVECQSNNDNRDRAYLIAEVCGPLVEALEWYRKEGTWTDQEYIATIGGEGVYATVAEIDGGKKANSALSALESRLGVNCTLGKVEFPTPEIENNFKGDKP